MIGVASVYQVLRQLQRFAMNVASLATVLVIVEYLVKLLTFLTSIDLDLFDL